MTSPGEDARELSESELQQESASDLPSREAMSLLDLNVDLAATLDLAAPINAAIAANANVAAPINASVGANIGSVDSVAISSAEQDSIIMQDLDGVAIADADQNAEVKQGKK